MLCWSEELRVSRTLMATWERIVLRVKFSGRPPGPLRLGRDRLVSHCRTPSWLRRQSGARWRQPFRGWCRP